MLYVIQKEAKERYNVPDTISLELVSLIQALTSDQDITLALDDNSADFELISLICERFEKPYQFIIGFPDILSNSYVLMERDANHLILYDKYCEMKQLKFSKEEINIVNGELSKSNEFDRDTRYSNEDAI